MREILFRAKCLSDGEWAFGYFVNLFMVNYEKYEPLITNRYTGFSYNVDIDTVGQFTGLLDKNGEKIFEGDIVVHHEIPMLVKWNEESSSFVVGYTMNEKYYENSLHGHGYLEVVGNIYDNTELFE